MKNKQLEKLFSMMQNPKSDGVQNAISKYSNHTVAKRKDPWGNFVIESDDSIVVSAQIQQMSNTESKSK